MENTDAFILARAHAMEATGGSRESIGVYREKLLHATLKFFYQPNEEMHEVTAAEGIVADALRGDEAIEIQTGGLFPVKGKLDKYFAAGKRVRLVHPVPFRKWIVWLDPHTGEASVPRKSPHTGSAADALYELYRLLPYLDDDRLTVDILLMDIWEYRRRLGKVRGRERSQRLERYPLSIVSCVTLHTLADYMAFIPETLGGTFTSKEYAAAVHMTGRRASMALSFLVKRGVLCRVGKAGQCILYAKSIGLKTV